LRVGGLLIPVAITFITSSIPGRFRAITPASVGIVAASTITLLLHWELLSLTSLRIDLFDFRNLLRGFVYGVDILNCLHRALFG
jgi:hypothetical protein